jgi:hypothetical protein
MLHKGTTSVPRGRQAESRPVDLSGDTVFMRELLLRMLSVIILAVALIFTSACTKKSDLSTGVDMAGMDKSVAPGDDFNAYTNGGWIKETPIPADKSSYGVGAHSGNGEYGIRRRRGCQQDWGLLFELHG